jgi:hypothetical protein
VLLVCLTFSGIESGPGAGCSDDDAGSLMLTCANEAKMLIPSLAGKLLDDDLEDLCRPLQRLKFQAQ